jgi:hypothetical protein
MNEGCGGNNSDFIMDRNSITAPFHTNMQVQPSECSMIPFSTICGSHSSVDENSSLLVYYIELIGKTLLGCQSSMLLPSKGKGVPVHVMKVYWEFEVYLHSLRTSLPERSWVVGFRPWHF